MQALLSNAEFWVVAGVALFFVMITALKVPGVAARALDDRAAKIQAALDEAERLREEARDLVTSLKARREEAEVQAKEMLKDAKAEAKRQEAEAKIRLEEQIARRTEAQAAADVNAAAIDLASRMAESVLAARLAGSKSDPSLDRAIGQLGERLQ